MEDASCWISRNQQQQPTLRVYMEVLQTETRAPPGGMLPSAGTHLHKAQSSPCNPLHVPTLAVLEVARPKLQENSIKFLLCNHEHLSWSKKHQKSKSTDTLLPGERLRRKKEKEKNQKQVPFLSRDPFRSTMWPPSAGHGRAVQCCAVQCTAGQCTVVSCSVVSRGEVQCSVV